MPIKTPSTAFSAFSRTFLFVLRLPFFLAYVATYFVALQYLPLPTVVRKLLLWFMMGIPGIWWVDLQLDGVKRGSLSQQPPSRVPHPGSVIAANHTSPVDAIYLSAIFDPIFTVSYPHSRKVRRVSLLRAVIHAVSPAQFGPPPNTGLTDLRALLRAHPDRVIAVFPECGTTNGRGILPFSPSLLSTPAKTKIFPVSMRYTPPDITTPIPGAWFAFLWKLLSRPTHCIHVRIAEGTENTTGVLHRVEEASGRDSGYDDGDEEDGRDVAPGEQQVLDWVADALARLGRNKRVGLTLRDKKAFTKAWKG